MTNICISYSPDDAKKVYVGTDYGVALSTDNGNTWFHKMLENTSPVWSDYGNWEPKKQNSVLSILALPNDKAIALCSTGVYLTDERFREGKLWTWNRIRDGSFIFRAGLSCKNIDVWPLDNNKIFILQDYYNLFLYELDSKRWTKIALPPLPKDKVGNDYQARACIISKHTTEIYVSIDNGEHWGEKAYVALDDEGVFAVSKWVSFGPIDPGDDSRPGSRGPVIYAPFKGNLTRPDGSKRVGLIRFTDVFSSTVDNYDEGDLLYLDDNGSLGSRFTEFDCQRGA